MIFGGVTIPGHPDLANIQKLDVLPVDMLRRMSRIGIAIDREWFADLSCRLDIRKQELRKDILEFIPEEQLGRFLAASDSDEIEFNVNSASQIGELLFDMLGVGRGQKLKKTKDGSRISTGKKQLETLKTEHEVIPLILEFRECSKLKSTYTDSLPKKAVFHRRGECNLCGLKHEADTWRIHSQQVTTRTDTGRIASRKPNLANIPARTKMGREVRKGFIASPGKKLVARDFAQIELRLLADRAQEANMIRIFNSGGDLHLDTAMRAFNIDDPKKVDKMLHRAPCKNVNFGVCIAQGQLVLTDLGLIPIENVTQQMRVWDGYNFVRHEGVIWKGVKRVIEYDGLTATPDHKVWLRDGSTAKIAEAAASGQRIAVTESEGHPIRFPNGYFERNSCKGEEKLPGSLCEVRYVREYVGSTCGQSTSGQDQSLPGKPQEQMVRFANGSDSRPILCDELPLYKPQQQELEELRWTGNTERVYQPGTVCNLCNGESTSSNLQEDRYRQNRQQWELSTGKHSTGNSSRESNEPTTKAAKVYDIMNAGPHRRFTVAGKLVSNCYGLSAGGLFDLMAITYASAGVELPHWLDEEWCESFINKWFNLYPQAAEYFALTHYRARRYGIVWTPFGRVRQIPEVRSVHEKIRAAGLRQAGNMPIQGFAADVFKLGMSRVDVRMQQFREAGIYAEALLPIHDELVSEVDEEWVDEVGEIVGWEMSEALRDEETGEYMCRVPIATDGHSMSRWEKD